MSGTTAPYNGCCSQLVKNPATLPPQFPLTYYRSGTPSDENRLFCTSRAHLEYLLSNEVTRSNGLAARAAYGITKPF